jgi:redox-sensitive bicupin YhaK (pirin superfamily)
VGILIVLNDDEIEPHTGFALHHHANIEIVTYVQDGTITHHDDQGNVGTIHAGTCRR